MQNMKIPIIAASVAVVAVIATIIILTSGTTAGLYGTSVSGSVSIMDEDGNSPASADLLLSVGDTITVGDNSSFTITYKGKENSEDNYIVIGSNSRVIVSSKFGGSNDGELLLVYGSMFCNLSGESKGGINVRTANCELNVNNSVSTVQYYTNENKNYTNVFDYYGRVNPKSQLPFNLILQLLDSAGNDVNQPEPLMPRRTACVVTSELGPAFEYLNTEFLLSAVSGEDLRELITCAQLLEDEFTYPIADLRTAYEAASYGLTTTEQPTTPTVSEPVVTATPISTDVTTIPPEVTAAPPNTSFTTPPVTAAPPRTTTTTTTTAATTTANPHAGETLTVLLVMGEEESIYEVPYGGSLEKPADPEIEGFIFKGWQGSFTNITSDCTITAILEPIDPTVTLPGGGDDTIKHNVTVVVLDQSRTITVNDGESAKLQTSLEIPGYIFEGWDKDFTNITDDITITAILVPMQSVTHTVTFVIDGMQYPFDVAHGGTALPPFYPVQDSVGNPFTGWDKPLENITADTVITAIFTAPQIHEVTFIIDGTAVYVDVKHGETVIPPFTPTPNRLGQAFSGWDKPLTNITEDTVVTAIYQ
ncbi:MAG: InlB B-repeat-containing protein [Ruminococcus sp.]|jgi:hypothetical protein|nr:InlB B-repeat-containing protein [Ruminococcus sp.]